MSEDREPGWNGPGLYGADGSYFGKPDLNNCIKNLSDTVMVGAKFWSGPRRNEWMTHEEYADFIAHKGLGET